MADIFQLVMDFLVQYWWIFAILIGIVFVLRWLFKGRVTQKELKPLKRSEVERKDFIERMRHNPSMDFSWLSKGEVYIGKIVYFQPTIFSRKSGDQEPIKIFDMVLKPMLFQRFRLANPLAKEFCMSMAAENTEADIVSKELILKPKVTFDNLLGIFYDRDLREIEVPRIIGDQLHKTDFESLSSLYYAKAQEQSVIEPSRAKDILSEEIKLEAEKEKRHKAITGD